MKRKIVKFRMVKNHWNPTLLVVLTLCMVYGTVPVRPVMAVQMVLEADSVKVGRQICFEGNLQGYSFESSNEQTAYVSDGGVVTGKRAGEVTVTAVKDGKEWQFPLTVKADGKKPAIRVCRDELLIGKPFVSNLDGKSAIAFMVTNQSKKGTVKKLLLHFSYKVIIREEASEKYLQAADKASSEIVSDTSASDDANDISGDRVRVEERTATARCEEILPGESVLVYCTEIEGFSGLQEEKLETVTIYSGDAKLVWNEVSDLITGYDWGTEHQDEPEKPSDTKAPVIKGFVGKKSYNGNDIFVTLYADRKTAYKKYVTAYDKQDGKVSVQADLSRINWKRNGVYTITVSAKDKAGNQTKRKMKVQVRHLTGIDLYADRILRRITKPGWSDRAKCQAVYRYVQSHMRYVNYNGGKSWQSSALRGLRYGNGNCYAYYSLSRLLLTRAGIPSIMVTRYPAVPNHHHWWNLAYVKGGWYHFDTTPRRLRGRFCLLTDGQLAVYERRSPGTFRYQSSKYPKRARTVICGGPF